MTRGGILSFLFPSTSAYRSRPLSAPPKKLGGRQGIATRSFDNDIPVVVPAGNGASRSAPRAVDTVPALWDLSSSVVPAGVSCPLVLDLPLFVCFFES